MSIFCRLMVQIDKKHIFIHRNKCRFVQNFVELRPGAVGTLLEVSFSTEEACFRPEARPRNDHNLLERTLIETRSIMTNWLGRCGHC
jgi:hypothetical protein